MLLGLGDVFVLTAMVGSVLITAVCVVFGAVTWNSGAER